MSDTLTHFIDGKQVAGEAVHESINPSDLDDVVARYPKGGAQEVDAAVQAARAAFPAWSEASPEVRSDLLDRVGTVLLERRETLGRLLSHELRAERLHLARERRAVLALAFGRVVPNANGEPRGCAAWHRVRVLLRGEWIGSAHGDSFDAVPCVLRQSALAGSDEASTNPGRSALIEATPPARFPRRARRGVRQGDP